MNAVSCTQGRLAVVERSAPTPGRGHVVIDVLRCGICGSDLHARHHCDALADVAAEIGYDGAMRSHHEVIFGHEFCGTVAEHGLGCRKSAATGTHVVAFPLLRRGRDVHPIGLSAAAPVGYAEQVIVEESLTVAVPNGLAPDTAALTEPMAVAWHAVRRGEVKKGTVAIVIGCGPVGLGVICMLKASGVRHVIASDLSPGRRALAERCGASRCGPDAGPALRWMRGPRPPGHGAGGAGAGRRRDGEAQAATRAMGAALARGRDAGREAEEPGGLRVRRGARRDRRDRRGRAPLFSRVVVVGVCMGGDQIRPAMAINKEIELRFVLGYTPLEFRDTLHMLADGKIDAAPLVTGVVGLPEVEGAFDALGDPERHAKILIDPKRRAAEPASA